MKLKALVNSLDHTNKRYFLLTVTPKGYYPDELDSKGIEEQIITHPNDYTYLYEEDEPEITHKTAFRLFILKHINDKYKISEHKLHPVRRLRENEVILYFTIDHYYDTVRSGISEMNEDKTIKEGSEKGKAVLEKYPLSDFEYGFVAVGRELEELNLLVNIEFKSNDNYMFNHIYIN